MLTMATASRSPVSRLPAELLDWISELLSQDSEYSSSLANLALTHSTFREPAQRRLLNHVKLCPSRKWHQAEYHPAQDVLPLLENNPRLGTFVKRLDLAIGLTPGKRLDFKLGRSENALVKSIVGKLPNITDVLIDGYQGQILPHDGHGREVFLERIALVQELLAARKRSGRLARLTVRHVADAPLSFIHFCMDVAPDLTFFGAFGMMDGRVTLDAEKADATRDAEFRPVLRSLSLHYCVPWIVGNLLGSPAFAPYFGALRELVYHGERLCELSAKTLERLVLDSKGMSSTSSPSGQVEASDDPPASDASEPAPSRNPAQPQGAKPILAPHRHGPQLDRPPEIPVPDTVSAPRTRRYPVPMALAGVR